MMLEDTDTVNDLPAVPSPSIMGLDNFMMDSEQTGMFYGSNQALKS